MFLLVERIDKVLYTEDPLFVMEHFFPPALRLHGRGESFSLSLSFYSISANKRRQHKDSTAL